MKIILAMPCIHTARGIIGNNCAKTLKDLGHEVHIFDISGQLFGSSPPVSFIKSAARRMFPHAPSPIEFGPIKNTLEKRISKSLLEAAARFKPDLVLSLMGENISPEALQAIKSDIGARTANWVFDPIILDDRRKFLNRVAAAYDYIFLVESLSVLKSVSLPSRKIYSIPLAVDPEKFRHLTLTKGELKRYSSDVAFIGTVTELRENVLKTLRDFDMKIWGLWDKKNPDLEGFYAEQDVYGEKAVKIFNAAKIVIDVHPLFKPGKDLYYVSPRLFEVPSCGAFLLAPYSCQSPELYKLGEEMVCYKDYDELKRLIRYYLDHPEERSAIAEKAYERVHKEHTYSVRLKKLIDIVSDTGRSDISASVHPAPDSGKAGLPAVSFVIPSFNGKALLKKYLPLILKDVREDKDEVIIVDDGSTDGTVQFLKETYPSIRVVEFAENRGFAHAANAGFLAARHDYICSLNSDILVEEGFLAPLLKHFSNDDVFSVCALELHPPGYQPVFWQTTADFKFGIFWYNYEKTRESFKSAAPLLFSPGSCTVYDKRKFFSLGGFDAIFNPFYWEDMDICFRAWERGWKCLCESESRHRHEHQATISQNYSPFFIQTIHWKNRFLFMWKNIRSMRYIIGHLICLVPELVLFPILGKPQFTIGFFKALGQLPEVLRRRREVGGKYVFTDREVIAKFKQIK